MYYLKSRYYDPEICRFINADGYASTGQGFIGANMFAYCLNSPVNYVDSSGDFPLLVLALVCVVGLLLTSDGESASIEKENAHEKYNKKTMTFSENEIINTPNKVNVTFYPEANLIHIENSYNISSKYEQEAIISEIMASEYYNPDIYSNSPDRMMIEWSAHNFVYHAASKYDFMYQFFVRIGYETPVESTRGVDFRFSLAPSTERNYNIVTMWGRLHW